MISMRQFAVLLLVTGCAVTACTKQPTAPTPEDAVTKPVAVEPATATSDTGTVAANDNAPAKAPPLLWKVTGPNGPSWLFGTIHVGVDAKKYVHEIAFEQAATARVFVMEADLSTVDQAALMALASLPEGDSLDKHLTPEQWATLTKLAPLPEAALKKFQPWFIVTVISTQMVPMTTAVDLVLFEHAKQAGVTVEYLETWQHQLGIASESITMDDLRDLLDDPEVAKQEMMELVAAYKAGDPERVEALMFDPEKVKKSPKMFADLLIGRNKQWMPAVTKYVTEGNAFIAVGAGHLLGTDSVIDLLRKQGYTVERADVGKSADTGISAPRNAAAK